MRPTRFWIRPALGFILAVIQLLRSTYGQDPKCYPVLEVRRNTVVSVFSGEDVKINCTIHFCTNSTPYVLWSKMCESSTFYWNPVNRTGHTETMWMTKTENKGISFLKFTNISPGDAGLYRCTYGSAVSHSINVTVSEKVEITTIMPKKNETNKPEDEDSFLDQVQSYIYCLVGFPVLVVMVLTISILLRRGSRARKAGQAENRYMDIPMSQQASPHPDHAPLPLPNPQPRSHQPPLTHRTEGIYDNAPSRKTPPRTAPPPAAANQAAAPEVADHIYGNRKAEGRGGEGETSDLLYATLNHQLPPKATAHRPRPQEECSEYAAIRIA